MKSTAPSSMTSRTAFRTLSAKAPGPQTVTPTAPMRSGISFAMIVLGLQRPGNICTLPVFDTTSPLCLGFVTYSWMRRTSRLCSIRRIWSIQERTHSRDSVFGTDQTSRIFCVAQVPSAYCLSR